MEIKNKVAIVTGASSGIGLALARELSRRGAKVVLAARSADKLAELASEIPGSLAIPADMTKPEDILTLIGETKEKLGRVDILVNNAGLGLRSSVEATDLQEYESIMELNVFSVLRAMQAAIPIMRAQGAGVIMNISSLVSKNAFPGARRICFYQVCPQWPLVYGARRARERRDRGERIPSAHDRHRLRPERARIWTVVARNALRHGD